MKKYLLLIILSGLLFTGCDSFLDINSDPNNPTEVSPDLVLPVAQTYTASYNTSSRRTNHLGNMLMYNWSETYGFSWYDEEFKYLVTPTFYDQLFNLAYRDALKQYDVLSKLEGEEFANYKAIASVMKAFHFNILVDLYGDVPYFEALGRGTVPTPVYDDARAIYDDLLVKLEEAVALIDATQSNELALVPGDDDAIFGGSMENWAKFANTIKLRILVRMSDVADISAGVSAINANGYGYITGDVAVNPGYANEEDKQNPFWATLGAKVDGTVTLSNDATCATQYILDYLTTTNDTRIDFMYELPDDGHLGVEQGFPVGQDYGADFVSNIGPGHLKGADMDAVIFTLAESYFNQAEAAVKGHGGDAEALYNAGVEASFAYLGAGSSATYLSQMVNNIAYASSSNKLEAIITQKWLALNGVDAVQSWFDYTRTGFPRNLPVSLLASTSDRPVRLAYPSSEITSNTANLPDQPDVFTSKIFWAN
jgi:hypothetical protein